MRSRWNWTRPEPRIYSYNTDPSSFQTGYSSASSSSRSARASSVAVASESSNNRLTRATTVAPGASAFDGYSGFYGKSLASHQTQSSAAASSLSSATAAAAMASATKVSSTTTTAVRTEQKVESQKTESIRSKVDMMKEHQQSLDYGKNSRSSALRRAEIHAVNSGKDPRHVMVPRNLDDDICKKVADIHMYDTKSMSAEGRLKVEKLEKELNALISSSMSYKSAYAKSAKQMASEAMMACDTEASQSSRKIRKTVVESSGRRAVAV